VVDVAQKVILSKLRHELSSWRATLPLTPRRCRVHLSPVPDSSPTQRQLLDASGVNRCLNEIAEAIMKRWPAGEKLALVGIYRRGVPFAEALAARLMTQDREIEIGRIDITQYRDDLKTFTVLPKLEGSDIDFDLEDCVVILCDEVVYTARTTRAALEELLDFGRPKCVHPHRPA
jgi:pyrimidine operon attenuation protein / uracil phosphoribosyltransferase